MMQVGSRRMRVGGCVNQMLYVPIVLCLVQYFFFFSSRRRHTRSDRDWSSDVCSSDLHAGRMGGGGELFLQALGVSGQAARSLQPRAGFRAAERAAERGRELRARRAADRKSVV